MTREDAEQFVRDTFDDDSPSEDELREVFTALYNRPPDGDEVSDIWSHVCSAVSHCACSTRSEHKDTCEAIERLKTALTSGDRSGVVMVSEWDGVTMEEGWDVDNITAFAILDSPLINSYRQRGDYYLAETCDGNDIVLTQYGHDVATLLVE